MWPFKKKKEVKARVLPPKKCEHKYKDFDWYVTSNYYLNTNILKVEIIEPYVCIFCGNRIDKELHTYATVCDKDKINKKVKDFIEPYQSKLKERAFIEDEINDFILVDKDYIEAYMLIHNKRGNKMDFVLLFILALGTVCSIANMNKSNDFLSKIFTVLVSCILLLTTIGTFVRIIITALGV